MDIGFLWGQWVGLLGRLQGNQVQASSKILTVSFLAAFTPFTPWGCLFFTVRITVVIRAWLGKKNINKRHFAWGNTPVKPPFPPGEIHQESGEPGSRTRAKLAIPVAEEPAAFALKSQLPLRVRSKHPKFLVILMGKSLGFHGRYHQKFWCHRILMGI